MSEAIRVAVVDDERHIRELLEIGLAREGFAVRSAANGSAALSLVESWHPSVVILDVMLPHIDGFALLPMLRKKTQAPIIMLTALGDVPDRVAGLSRGADDYLAKPFAFEELLARLQAALRRPALAEPQTLAVADLSVDLGTREVKRGARSIDLTAREYDLLVTLMRSPRRVFSKENLLDLVWGIERDVNLGTVETYISYLRAKIDHADEPKLLHTIRGAGYSLRAEAA
jgi:DNA-binding response OmpR family regulator